MTRAHKTIAAAAVVASVALLSAAAYYKLDPGGHSIPTTGGESLQVVIPAPRFLQTDRRWAGDRIGGSSEMIRRVGCTLCCLSMALCSRGFECDPGSLNRMLIERDGYTSRGWIIWAAVEQATGGAFDVVVLDSPDHTAIDSQLKVGNPVIAKLPEPDGTSHWVLIAGKTGREYVAIDPLDSKNAAPVPIGHSRRIGSIRYLYKR